MATTTKKTKATETASEAAAADKDAGANQGGALATQSTQAIEVFEDYGEDATKGYENQTPQDRKVPMVFVVQANSPQAKEKGANGKPLAFAGQLYNSITKEAYDAIEFVPVITDHSWIEYRDRDAGGGFRGRHALDAQIVKDAQKRAGRNIGKLPVPQPDTVDAKGQAKKSPDHELVETYEIAGVLVQAWRDGMPLFVGDQPEMPIMLTFKSTHIRSYKDWNTSVSMFQLVQRDASGAVKGKSRVPMFAHRVKMTTRDEQKGSDSWSVPVLTPAVDGEIARSLLKKTDARYQAGLRLHADYVAGRVKADYEAQSSEDSGSSSGAKGPATEGDSAF